MPIMPCATGIAAYTPPAPAWFERRAPTQATPVRRAISTAALAANDITRWPMPLSPSTIAVAGPPSITASFGCGLMRPARNQRTYWPRRKMPCASEPARSASIIAAATTAASSGRSPHALNACAVKAAMATPGTRTSFSPPSLVRPPALTSLPLDPGPGDHVVPLHHFLGDARAQGLAALADHRKTGSVESFPNIRPLQDGDDFHCDAVDGLVGRTSGREKALPSF